MIKAFFFAAMFSSAISIATSFPNQKNKELLSQIKSEGPQPDQLS